MKRYTSKFLKTIALLYLTFPVIYIFFAALLFDIPASNCVRILLSPLYYLVAALAVVAGYGLWEMKRWAWVIFMWANVLIGYANAILIQDYSSSHHRGLAFGASVLILLLMIVRVAREVRVPYFFPKIRWWESNPRYRLSVPVRMSRGTGDPIQGDILDLSLGGCFVKIRSGLQQDELVGLKFSVFGIEMSCEGVVVWRTESAVTHPKGIGIKFTPLDRHHRRKLRMITKRLKKLSALYRQSRHLMTQEEFNRRLRALETNRGPEPVASTDKADLKA